MYFVHQEQQIFDKPRIDALMNPVVYFSLHPMHTNTYFALSLFPLDFYWVVEFGFNTDINYDLSLDLEVPRQF